MKLKKRYEARTIIAAHRRVLRLLDSHLATLNPDTLVATDQGGLFTRAELRQHIASALALKVRR